MAASGDGDENSGDGGGGAAAAAAGNDGAAAAPDGAVAALSSDVANLTSAGGGGGGGGGGEAMSLDERVQLILSVAKGGECVTEDELRALLARKGAERPRCYDGFEPSGRMHIAQGVLKAINVNKLTDAGCEFTFWVADWFAQLNDKMGGDLRRIHTVGRYFIEVWRACGMRLEHVRFVWASEEINAHAERYWTLVMDIARRNSLARVVRCSQIMGRAESYELAASQIFYPCMQCADVFFLRADICQLGMDQRKVNMLAREYAEVARPRLRHKPISLSHHMLPGLRAGEEKMSKSSPDSAIFMEDSEEDIRRKVKRAFCPERQLEANPLLEYVEYLVLPSLGVLAVRRAAHNGGDVQYADMSAVRSDFAAGRLHPADLKAALAAALIEITAPVREHFRTDPTAKQLLEQVRRYRADK